MNLSKTRKSSFKYGSMVMAVILVLSVFLGIPPQAAFAAGTTYYVDAAAGDDGNGGTTQGTAWKTLDKVNSTAFAPGDKILFKAGERWTGTLYPKGSGESGNPIVIDMYGSGSKPRLDGNGLVSDVVYFNNQQYWEINNLEITNTAMGAPADAGKLGDFRGIHVTGKDAGTLKHFRLKNLYIHDVTGWVRWIGGSSANNAPGIQFQAGWDGSKRTGGILFEILQPGAAPVKTNFDDVIIEDSVLKDNSFAGIIFKQWNGTAGWANRDGGENDPDWFPHTNIIVRNNYLSHYNSNYACDTIYLTSVRNALVEGNISAGAGTSAIEFYYGDHVIVQYNEVYDTVGKAGGADSNAIDPDKEVTNALIQYNYIHNTGDGILLCGFSFGSAIVRYNVIKDAEKRFINPHADKGIYLVYNNIFYNTRTASAISLVESSGGGSYLNDSNCFYKFYNNIFYNAAGTPGQSVAIGTGTGMTYDSNMYYGNGVNAPSSDMRAIFSDPKFVGPLPTVSDKGTDAGNPYLSLDGFKLVSGSLAIGNGLDGTGMNLAGSGMIFTDNGGVDFGGNGLYNGRPDIGIFEYYGAPGATESVTGRVKDAAGNGIAGAAVSINAGGTSHEGVSDLRGFFSITDVPVGTGYTVTASKELYLDGTVTVNVVAGDTTSGVNLALTSIVSTGMIAGKVKDATGGSGTPLSGVTVTVSAGGNTYGTATTDASGNYSFGSIPPGTDYSVTASMVGYQPWTVGRVAVTAANTTTLSDIYISAGKPNYLINDTFDAYTNGSQPADWTKTTTVAGGSVSVTAFPDDTDKSVRIAQPASGSSGQRTSLYKSLNDVKGILTIEYEILRTSTAGYYCLPYVYADSAGSANQVLVCMVMNNGNIAYRYNGSSGSTVNLMPFTTNTWYKFKIIVNAVSQSYDIYINDVKRADAVPFRYKNSGSEIFDTLRKLEFYTDYNITNGEFYLNNFRLSTGIAYPVNDADLSGIQISSGTLVKVNETQYYASVPNYVDQITITPTADSIFASAIAVNGNSTVSGQASQNISLSEGDNEIPIVVTAEDGITTKTYTVTLNRISADVDAHLRSLTLSSGALEPVFSHDTLNYAVSVLYSVGNITVTPVTSAPNATIMVNDTGVENGRSSQSIELNSGNNNIKVEVNSEDGTNYKTYSIIVTRGASPNGWISGIVRDSMGNAVSGALVSVVDSVYSAVTDETGNYTVGDVPPGEGYSLTAGKTGYTDGTITGVDVAANTTTTVNDIILLDIPQLSAIIVSGSIPALTAGGTGYDLNNLSVNGKDQYNNAYNLSGLPVLWKIASGEAYATLNGSILAPVSAGSGTVMAAVYGVSSNSVSFIVNRASSGDNGSSSGTPAPTPSPAPVIDSSGNINAVPKLDKNTGVATTAIDKPTLAEAFEKAAGSTDGKKIVAVIIPPVEGAKAYKHILPASVLSSTDTDRQIEIRTGITSVTLPSNMLPQEAVAGAKDVSVTIVLADVSKIDNAEARDQIGDRPVIQLSMTVDEKPYSWLNEDVPVTVSIPYKPTAQELADPEHMTIWYIDGKGNVIEVPSGRYNPVTGKVTFSTTHFSNYAVVYVTKSFDDLGSVAWAKKAIEVLASKGILKGVSEKEYLPQKSITRADYLYFLIRTLGVEAGFEANFADIDSDAYYYRETGIAKKLGISNGTGNNKFDPNAGITRQDMIVLTERALRLLKKLEEQGTASDLDEFTDKSLIAAYAVDSIAAVVREGLIVGSSNRILPLDSTTRAEAAVFLYRIYNKYW